VPSRGNDDNEQNCILGRPRQGRKFWSLVQQNTCCDGYRTDWSLWPVRHPIEQQGHKFVTFMDFTETIYLSSSLCEGWQIDKKRKRNYRNKMKWIKNYV